MYACEPNRGWLVGADRILPSPNCNKRPYPQDISLLVIHGIHIPGVDFVRSMYVDAMLTGRFDARLYPLLEPLADLRVSAHILIDRDGRVTQYVPFIHRAWHAGYSIFQGRENCNDFSIGIELLGADQTPYTEAQYWSLAHIASAIMQAYPDITPSRVTGHSDIALPKGRKTDPGSAFSWEHFHRLREQISIQRI